MKARTRMTANVWSLSREARTDLASVMSAKRGRRQMSDHGYGAEFDNRVISVAKQAQAVVTAGKRKAGKQWHRRNLAFSRCGTCGHAFVACHILRWLGEPGGGAATVSSYKLLGYCRSSKAQTHNATAHIGLMRSCKKVRNVARWI